ncbi:MAG: hypothetical protein RL268_192 [Pseudomonadota bacterium]|jgi:hypothetical protein
MIFSNPDERRALRSAVNAAMALIGLGFVGWIIWLLAGEAGFLFYIALSLLAINFAREIFAGVENVSRAVKARIGKDGLEMTIGDKEPEQ